MAKITKRRPRSTTTDTTTDTTADTAASDSKADSKSIRFLTFSELQASADRQRQELIYAVTTYHLAVVRRLKAIEDLEFLSLLQRAPILAPGVKPSDRLTAIIHEIARYRKQGIGQDAQITALGPGNRLSIDSPIFSLHLDPPSFSLITVGGNLRADPQIVQTLIGTHSQTLAQRLAQVTRTVNQLIGTDESKINNLLLIRRLIYVRWAQKYGLHAARTIAHTTASTTAHTTARTKARSKSLALAQEQSSWLVNYGGMQAQDLITVNEQYSLQYQQLLNLVHSFLTYLTIGGAASALTYRSTGRNGTSGLERPIKHKVQKLGGRLVTGTKVLIDGQGTAIVKIPGILSIKLAINTAIRKLQELLNAAKIETTR